MNLIDRKEEEYEMTGWYSDVWSELPVCRLYATENHKEAFLSHLFLQDIMNFTYTLRKPPDGQWGSLMKNGTWTGMVNELHLKKADIGMNTF